MQLKSSEYSNSVVAGLEPDWNANSVTCSCLADENILLWISELECGEILKWEKLR